MKKESCWYLRETAERAAFLCFKRPGRMIRPGLPKRGFILWRLYMLTFILYFFSWYLLPCSLPSVCSFTVPVFWTLWKSFRCALPNSSSIQMWRKFFFCWIAWQNLPITKMVLSRNPVSVVRLEERSQYSIKVQQTNRNPAAKIKVTINLSNIMNTPFHVLLVIFILILLIKIVND